MKVKNLIEWLQEYPPDLEVVIPATDLTKEIIWDSGICLKMDHHLSREERKSALGEANAKKCLIIY